MAAAGIMLEPRIMPAAAAGDGSDDSEGGLDNWVPTNLNALLGPPVGEFSPPPPVPDGSRTSLRRNRSFRRSRCRRSRVVLLQFDLQPKDADVGGAAVDETLTKHCEKIPLHSADVVLRPRRYENSAAQTWKAEPRWWRRCFAKTR
ncbi:hypothetical protein RJ641_013002 [Dillenia turbinata]|uniref:Uncharacterized protein n=1 Tax=Dillenia turbinata TaxID=194707 RepID=A0AAN8W332_9MAGN